MSWSSIGKALSGGSGSSGLSSLGSSLGNGIGSGLNSIFGVSQSQQQQYEYNKELQELAQQWQESMSNTAYQRSVNDLTQAGLNPLLSYASGGATTGSASASGTGSGTGAGGSALASLVGSFMASLGSGQYDKNTAEANRSKIESEDKAFRLGLLKEFLGDKNDPLRASKLWQFINHGDSSAFGQLSRAVSSMTSNPTTRSSGGSASRNSGRSVTEDFKDELRRRGALK